MGEYGGEIEGEHPWKSPPAPEDSSIKVERYPSEVVVERKLTFEEASKCLNTLGRDETGARYAYLKVTVSKMKLTNVSILIKFKHLLFLDLSGNYLNLEAIQVLEKLPFLVELNVEQNLIDSLAVKSMSYLQVLNLNRNQIKYDDDVVMQPYLETLQLNWNRLRTVDTLCEKLRRLRQLEVRSNQLFEINSNYPETVEKLYLATNTISYISPDSFRPLTKLQILHLRENNLCKLNGFGPTMESLQYLNLRSNLIGRFREILKLQCLPKLEVLILLDNPIMLLRSKTGLSGLTHSGEGKSEDLGHPEEEDQEGVFAEDATEDEDLQNGGNLIRFRLKIICILPNLKRLNKMVITNEERLQARLLRDELMAEVMSEPEDIEDDSELSTNTDLIRKYFRYGEFVGEGDEPPKLLCSPE